MTMEDVMDTRIRWRAMKGSARGAMVPVAGRWEEDS
jgi:hypothetical protein